MVNYLKKGNCSLKSFGIALSNTSISNAFRTGDEKMTEFKKIESEVKKFEKEGDSLQGVLVAVEKGVKYDNKVYKIKTKENKVVAVFGTTVLEQLMSSVSLGQEVQIMLTGFKENKIKGKAPIKLFEVYSAVE